MTPRGRIYRARRTLVMSARPLGRRKLRSFLSALGVVCGVAAVFSMISVGEGARRSALKNMESLGMKNILIRAKELSPGQKGRAAERLSFGLRLADAERIAGGLPAVKRIAAVREAQAPVVSESESAPRIAAVTAGLARVSPMRLREGRFISDLDVEKANLVCVLGSEAARSFRDGGPGALARLGGVEYKVVGVIERRSLKTAKGSSISPRDINNTIFIPLGAEPAQWEGAARGGAPDAVSEIIVEVESAGDVMAAAGVIGRILEMSHSGVDDYSIIIPLELFRKAMETARTLSLFLGSIAGISLLVGGIGIMNIMLATVTERKREIGVRRAVGASRGHIMTQFLCETTILTTAGGATGLLAGFVMVELISRFSGWDAAIAPWSIALSIAMSVGAGLFSGLYPAWAAARIDPLEALRE